MPVRWYSIVIDCHDPLAQAQWWSQVLDWPIVYESEDEVVIVPPHAADEDQPWPRGQEPLAWVFVPVPEGKSVKNRLHVDLAPYSEDDQAVEVARLVELGAEWVDVGQDESRISWIVLADPEGNEFCVLSPRDR